MYRYAGPGLNLNLDLERHVMSCYSLRKLTGGYLLVLNKITGHKLCGEVNGIEGELLSRYGFM